MKTPSPMFLWAVVIIQRRSTWIHWHTIRRTRREATEAYLEGFDEAYRTKQVAARGKEWRTVRVLVECVHSGSKES